jgi:hypothetical protein
MSRNNSLLPWKSAFDNASRNVANKSAEQMFQNRQNISELLEKNERTLKATLKKTEKIKRLSEPLSSINSTSKSIMGFAEDGRPRSFDVASISDPFQFANDFHFDIAFLQELIPICLSSLASICKRHLLSDRKIKNHNMRMASEVQTFISYYKNPVDIAVFTLSLNQNKHKLPDQFIDNANLLIKRTNHSLKNVSFEENMFNRLKILDESTEAINYFTTPNNYLFSQKLALYFGVDIFCNSIKTEISTYLMGCCPIKNNLQHFDFLRYLFIPKEVLDVDIAYRHISIFRAFDSLQKYKHGIVNALTPQEKQASSPLSLYRSE